MAKHSFADTARTTRMHDPAEFQKILDDYKTYLSKVSQEDRKEVVAFRIEIAKQNKIKKKLYTNLSPNIKEYLKKDYDYKSKFPMNEESLKNNGKLRDPSEFQKIASDYYTYVGKVPATTRHEARAFRKKIEEINETKHLLYKKLSHSAQLYLKNEQEYRKKLPKNRKILLRIDE